MATGFRDSEWKIRQAEKAVEPKVSQAELDALRKPVEAAKGGPREGPDRGEGAG